MNRPASGQPPRVIRPGITRVELLAILGVCLTLVGVAVPALLSSREASRRTTCLANLGQLSRAVAAFDGQKLFIPGLRNAHPNPSVFNSGDSRPKGSVSWPVLILPNIECQETYTLWSKRSDSNSGAVPNSNPAPAIAIFNCPASPSEFDYQPTLAYAGNGGIGVVANAQWKNDSVMLDTLGVVGGYDAARTSVEFVNSGDGGANTLLLAEKCGPLYSPLAFYDMAPRSLAAPTASTFSPGIWFSPGQPNTPIPAFGIFSDLATPLTSPMLNSKNPITALDSAITRPSSKHSGGVLVAFVDGHCRALSEAISPQTYGQLLTPNSGSGEGRMAFKAGGAEFLPAEPLAESAL